MHFKSAGKTVELLQRLRSENLGWVALAAHQRCYLTGLFASAD